jgi:adenylate cyclase
MLSAYLGRNVGGRILAGHIQRGDTEAIEAVILFLDLKGFTEISNSLPPEEVIALLNHFYDQVVPPVEAQGGEVLKFMGDGFVATFATEMGPDGAMAALSALHDAERRIAAANAERAEQGVRPIGYRASLHIGRVLFGNVGARHRVDFTVIGPAVNLAARLLAVASALDVDWVCSEPFAALTPWAKRSLGLHALKGFGAPQQVFAMEKP